MSRAFEVSKHRLNVLAERKPEEKKIAVRKYLQALR
jgi:hypothetical protein